MQTIAAYIIAAAFAAFGFLAITDSTDSDCAKVYSADTCAHILYR